VKIPKPPDAPPPERALGADHDTAFVRKHVKGAAGGMAGADYVEDVRNKAVEAKSEARKVKGERPGEIAATRAADATRAKHASEVVRDPALMALEDEDVQTKETKRKQREKPTAARDRLAVDKDAPRLIRKRKWTDGDDEEDEGEAEELARDFDFDQELDRIADVACSGPRAHLFAQDQRMEPGDPSLLDPEEIQRAFQTPVEYAKHAMILAEAFRRSTGADREEAIELLARMFVCLGDKRFARQALKEFGHETGIIDIYPLEVIERVLRRYPGFLTKFGFGEVVRNAGADLDERLIRTDTLTPVSIEHAPELKIRGFAIKGGGRIGYTFEPEAEPGKYRLAIKSAGRFTIMISALHRSGYTTIDRIAIRVRPRKVIDLIATIDDASFYPERDDLRVSAWPMPPAPRIDPRKILEEEEKPSPERKASSELARMKQIDALRGPQSGRSLDLDVRAAFEIGGANALGVSDLQSLRDAVESVLEAAEVIADDVDPAGGE
jgi:hypothetical protein